MVMIPDMTIVHQQRYRSSDRRTDYWRMIPDVIIVHQQRYRPSDRRTDYWVMIPDMTIVPNRGIDLVIEELTTG